MSFGYLIQQQNTCHYERYLTHPVSMMGWARQNPHVVNKGENMRRTTPILRTLPPCHYKGHTPSLQRVVQIKFPVPTKGYVSLPVFTMGRTPSEAPCQHEGILSSSKPGPLDDWIVTTKQNNKRWKMKYEQPHGQALAATKQNCLFYNNTIYCRFLGCLKGLPLS